MNEEWRAVGGYESAYEVSSLGRVRSVDRIVPSNTGRRLQRGQAMTRRVDRKGYAVVMLSGRGARTKRAHGLVAEAFLGPRPPDAQVDHIDGDKVNNAVTNLRYVTGSENIRAAHAAGRNKSGITDADVLGIRRALAGGSVTQAQLAERFGVHQGTISKFWTGRFRPGAQ